ncbi:hypothetical protein F5876DRAFT_80481 [Lentinula aff. lateritia]|uniref:Uncharacterized protein n=1 Tax=Lentinula aff. lateritia TaxID=2804960 RepID=A0ACC1TQ78_9AGAR|nr:hypothetical protein F5876DRAFT_80481 [Lentinula aff. lateritia]
MSLVIGGRNATAAFDLSMFYSAISRNFLTSECGICSSSGTFQSLVTFSTPYSAFTILADFFVVDDLGEYNAVIGLQIWRSCERLSCTEFLLALPRIQSTICSPLPPLPSHVPLGPGPSTHCTVQAALTDGLVTTVTESSVAASQSGHCVIGNVSSSPFIVSGASEPSSSMVIVETVASPSSESLLRASLLRKSVTGIHCSVFVEDMVLFSRYATLHGILQHGVVDVRSSRLAILHHILTGQCFDVRNSDGASNYHACHGFTTDYDTKTECFQTIAALLQSSKSVDLPVEKLKLMLESVCIKDTYHPHDTHRQMLRSLQRYLSRMQNVHVASCATDSFTRVLNVHRRQVQFLLLEIERVYGHPWKYSGLTLLLCPIL